ncbi:uncharacterized protein LOC120526407 [Polypterus senegalus]|uniref:uncharacterized protein LOC120526407 n=1 Tax=Polypterus senegalus TaxID=55291 RepID=UPI0019654FA4|nr:uncharacterized protein LOC120526407 [Polypterus senegalus]XP_039605500.1 uncharacterized protein LOC120526407 [Polypterus senegalus]
MSVRGLRARGRLVKSSLIFYTEHTAAWHSAFCGKFPNKRKSAICNGRQITVRDDSDPPSTVLVIDLYHNGTVLVQGSKASLAHFEEMFQSLREEVDRERRAAEAPRPDRRDAAAAPRGTAEHMQESLALLELEFAKFRDLMLGRLSDAGLTQQLRDEVCQVQRESRLAIADLVGRLREVQQDNEALKLKLAKVKQEMEGREKAIGKELQALREQLGHLEWAPGTPRLGAASRTPCGSTLRADGPRLGPEHPGELRFPEAQPALPDAQPPVDPPPKKSCAEVALLIDSNGKYIDTRRLFPGRRVTKIHCTNTERAMQLLSPDTLGNPRCIIVHTGTNDLASLHQNTAKAVKRVAERATLEFPEARVVISTLLPRADTPLHTINLVNAEIARGCAMLPNVHLAHHPAVNPWHLCDRVHLNQEGVRIFAKTLVDAVLCREPNGQRTTKRAQRHTQPSHSSSHVGHGASRPRSSARSYCVRTVSTRSSGLQQHAGRTSTTPQPPASSSSELGEIKKLLNILCARLLN